VARHSFGTEKRAYARCTKQVPLYGLGLGLGLGIAILKVINITFRADKVKTCERSNV
jgi:hypothetical protein